MVLNGSRVEPRFERASCTLCGLCVEACACGGINLAEEGPQFSCPTACPHPQSWVQTCQCASLCEEVCPTGAISWEYEIVADNEKDEDASTAE
jgi:formate hydrogenlyase subunit 6/NADH:ubiquinone oxidoreductase subunit I